MMFYTPQFREKNMPEETKSGWSVYGLFNSAYQVASQSFSEVWTETVEQVKAVPSFVKTMYSEKETRTVVKNAGVVIATDLVPIIAAQATMMAIDSYVTGGSGDPSFLLSAGAYLARWATRIFTTRQTIEALTRIGVLQAKQSSIFDKATEDVRNKVSKKVCEDCSTLRFIKGSIRAPLVYAAHQAVIALLEKLVGGKMVFAGYDFIVDGYSAQVIGELIAKYRLANDGLCDRHQHEFIKEFWERVFTLGLPVVIIRKLISALIETYTGIDASYVSPMLESFISIAMVGLAHHIDFPEPVKESERWSTPVSAVEEVTAYAMDKIAPDAIELGKRMFSQDGEPFDYRKAYKLFVNFYKDPKTQTVLMFVLPKMYLGGREFVNDDVVRNYWPPLQESVIEVLDGIEQYQPMLTDGAISYVPSKLTNRIAAYWLGVPKNAVKTASKLLKDEDFMQLVGELKVGITRLEVDMDEQGIVAKVIDTAYQYPPLCYFAEPDGKPQSSSGKIVELEDSEDKDFQIVPKAKGYIAKHETYDVPKLINAVKAGVNAYYQTAKGGGLSWISGSVGEKRAKYYLQLLNSHQAEPHKLLVCLAILSNKSGGTILEYVTKKVKSALSEKFRHTASLSEIRQTIFSELKPHLYSLYGCSDNAQARLEILKIIHRVRAESDSSLPHSQVITKSEQVFHDLDEIMESHTEVSPERITI